MNISSYCELSCPVEGEKRWYYHRRILISYTISCKHVDWKPKHTNGTLTPKANALEEAQEYKIIHSSRWLTSSQQGALFIKAVFEVCEQPEMLCRSLGISALPSLGWRCRRKEGRSGSLPPPSLTVWLGYRSWMCVQASSEGGEQSLEA